MYDTRQLSEEISKYSLSVENRYSACLVEACCTYDLTRLTAKTQAESLAGAKLSLLQKNGAWKAQRPM